MTWTRARLFTDSYKQPNQRVARLHASRIQNTISVVARMTLSAL